MDIISSIALFLQGITGWVISVMSAYGWFGVFIGMLLESAIVPIPSELILVTAGMTSIPLWQIVVAATIGSTIGSIIGYYIGRLGRPVIKKYGKYIFLTDTRINSAELWIDKHGGKAIFISRLIPFIPYKVFSITSGILKMDVKKFALFTFLGTIPRAIILATLGQALMNMQLEILAIIAIGIIIAFIVWHYKFRRIEATKVKVNPEYGSDGLLVEKDSSAAPETTEDKESETE